VREIAQRLAVVGEFCSLLFSGCSRLCGYRNEYEITPNDVNLQSSLASALFSRGPSCGMRVRRKYSASGDDSASPAVEGIVEYLNQLSGKKT